MAAIHSIEDLANALPSPGQASTNIVCYICPTEVFPSLNPELIVFPAMQFTASGEVMFFTGKEDARLILGVNQAIEPPRLVAAVLEYLMSLIMRRDLPDTLQSRAGTSYIDATRKADHAASKLSQFVLARARMEGDVEGLREMLRSMDISLAIHIADELRPTRESVDKAARFFQRAYYHLPAVRAEIDRIVYSFVGSGPRIVSSSAEVQGMVDQRSIGLATRHITSQSFRDLLLTGTSVQVTSTQADVHTRLVRPGLVSLERHREAVTVTDDGTGEQWSSTEGRCVVHTLLEQVKSPYGLPILEPVVNAIHQLMTIAASRQHTTSLLQLNAYEPQAVLSLLTQVAALEQGVAAQLDQAFIFGSDSRSVPVDDLYFPEWGKPEVWAN